MSDINQQVPYEARFAVGALVRIRPREALEEFRRTWTYHHPLSDQQVKEGNTIAIVKTVGFYHGGDPLYELEGVEGLWHESCLSPAA